MAKSRTLGTGGGSNKLVTSKAPKIEPRSRAINPAFAGQLGSSFGDHSEKGKGRSAAVQMDGGRALGPQGPTDNVKAVGVGGGRTVHSRGTQGTHGPVNPGNPTPTRDILSGFGPEMRRK